MLILLPVLSYLVLFFWLRNRNLGWMEAALGAATACGVCVVAITEILSLFRLVDRPHIALSWLAVSIAAGILWKFLPANRTIQQASQGFERPSLDPALKIALTTAGCIVITVGATALLSAPNMWDAMAYHLPRVTMWIGNQNVNFYPTPDYQQLIFGPFAEYAILHARLLWGSDRLTNLIQFLSMLGCLIGVAAIAKRCGADVRGQLLAVILSATIPEGVLEASGPMNGYVAAFWITTSVFFLFSWRDEPSWYNAIGAGVAAGLALLTKGTSYVLLPAVLLAAVWNPGKQNWRGLAKLTFLGAALVVMINAPHYLRCYEFAGSPLGLPVPDKTPRQDLAIPHITLRSTLANAVRNLALHTGTPLASANNKIEYAARAVITAIGENPDEPTALFLGEPFQAGHFSLHEVHAGNPLHVVLLLFSAGILALRWRRFASLYALMLAAGIVLSFLLFSAAIRWQEWGGRLHLPLFVLSSVCIATVLSAYWDRTVAKSLILVLVLFAVPFAFLNRTRSLIPWNRVADIYVSRSQQYFNDQHEALASSMIGMATSIRESQCMSLAIDSHIEDSRIAHLPASFYIYPLLALIGDDRSSVRFWYTNIHNLSSGIRHAKNYHNRVPSYA